MNLRAPLALLSILTATTLSACDVGSVNGPGGDRPDAAAAGPDADPTAPDADPAAPDAGSSQLDCRDAVANPGGGHHNAGQACIACHAGNAGPDYTIAGTLYATAAGGATVAGATITVVDANGTTVDLVTKTNGNFFTTQNLALPVRVMASQCPAAAEMSASVSNGDCNSSGCHSASGGAGRVYLP
ncbi:MAG: hypothetical protein H6708_18135 [Kofleriaceae bacterium]|nr:hypothetical protein [Kofleriaceae bacterium]